MLHACRLGRHGKVFLTIPSQSSTDEQKFIQKGEAPGNDSLFDIDSNTVFLVGGVPPDVRVKYFINNPSLYKFIVIESSQYFTPDFDM